MAGAGDSFPRLSDERIEALLVWDILASPEVIDEARRVARPDMFTNRHLREAFGAVCSRWDAREAVDASVVMSVADSDALRLLAAHTGSGGGIVETLNHARLLRQMWVARTAWNFGDRLMRSASEVSMMPEGVMSEARAFCETLESACGAASEMRLAEAVDELGETIRQTRETRMRGGLTAVPTGFPFLDERFLGGFKGGNLVTFAARPGIGKTAVMLAMMMRQASQGIPVKVWSLEMGHRELAERAMYALGGLRPGEKLSGNADWGGAWKEARERLERWGLYIEDRTFGLDEIVSDITVSRQQGRCSAAYIDYLQLVSTTGGRNDTEERRISALTRRLKLLAKSLDIPIVINAQLNRDNVRNDRDPELQDLRGSGSIEQDSDRVVFLSPRMSYDGARLIKMAIGKNREGGHAGDSVLLRPNATYSAFEEVTQDAPATIFPDGGDLPETSDEERRNRDPYFEMG